MARHACTACCWASIIPAECTDRAPLNKAVTRLSAWGQTSNPKPRLQAQERQKAELHFKLAMALQFAEKPEQALKELKVGAWPSCACITWWVLAATALGASGESCLVTSACHCCNRAEVVFRLQIQCRLHITPAFPPLCAVLEATCTL